MTVPTTASPNDVHLGPGILYAAPIGTSEPASVAALTGASAWREVGYTDDGTTFTYQLQTQDVMVEEEFDPVHIATTGRNLGLVVNMAETSRKNLALAYNAGADAANDNTAFEPPAPGAEVRIMLAWCSEEGAMWLFRRCINTGNVQTQRKKAPNKATFPTDWRIEKPAGAAPFKVFPTSSGDV